MCFFCIRPLSLSKWIKLSYILLLLGLCCPSLCLSEPPGRNGSSSWLQRTLFFIKESWVRCSPDVMRHFMEKLILLFSWPFLLFVSSFQLDQCEGHIDLHLFSPTVLEKYGWARDTGKRFIDPMRSQLIETSGNIPRLPLLRTLDVQPHCLIKQSLLTLEINYL